MATSAPLRITFVTGNAKKLEGARLLLRCCAREGRLLRRQRRRRSLCRVPEVQAILGTEHSARFVLDAVSLDLPELQARR